MKRKILFITGTRADYGKLKPLMKAVEADVDFECYIFVSGMHLIETFGHTYEEIIKDGYENIFVPPDISSSNNMSLSLGQTILSVSHYILYIKPDMVVVHGDRIEALAATVAGALNNIIVAHIEGGEVSGTIDESIRHSISKFAHIHFTANLEATKRLIQMGEREEHIFQIGSPDIDIMLSENLPSINEVMERYDIKFTTFAILIYHPVTTEIKKIKEKTTELVNAIIRSQKNYVVILPNNDSGSEIIINEYKRFHNLNTIKIFPSVRFEYFLTLMKNAEFIIGNSSAGIRESGVYALPAIDMGNRQVGRYNKSNSKNIQYVEEYEEDILEAIQNVDNYRKYSYDFGKGRSKEQFMRCLHSEKLWEIELQKKFIDIGETL